MYHACPPNTINKISNKIGPRLVLFEGPLNRMVEHKKKLAVGQAERHHVRQLQN